MNKENKPAAMISHTYLSLLPSLTYFGWCCCCSTSLPGTRPVQWGWNGNERYSGRCKTLHPCSWFNSSLLNWKRS